MAKVTFIVTKGPLQGRTFVFEKHDVVLFGRHEECHIRLPDDDRTASRRHFMLEVNPPLAQVRDLGSLHGTWLNGEKVGGREAEQKAHEVAGKQFGQVQLSDGDQIQVGLHIMRVQIEADGIIVPPLEQDPPQNLLDRLLKRLGLREINQLPTLGDYVLEKELGKGAFGIVYLARHRHTSQRVALKIMQSHVAVNEKARKLFEREIEIAKRLKHPSIVRLLEAGSVERLFYFTMQYCDSGTVEDWRQGCGGKIPFEQAAPIMRQVLEGLAYVHQQGIIHRDLKPANILLKNVGGVYVAKMGDFGVAKGFIEAGLSGLSITGHFAGTPDFMPKEQLTNFKYLSPAADVWSIAATFYLMLTGQPPRVGNPGDDWLLVVATGKAIPILQREPNPPLAFARAIDHALQANPSQRFRTAAHMLKGLEGVL
jgi:pSer/pThr/pTyr-binding forkhead associated (FHA) protein/predicted Ser/Thr protein kinase